jgi:hypothetical protein
MSHHYSGPDWGFPHRDASLDITDLYAFPKPGDAGQTCSTRSEASPFGPFRGN